MASGFCLRAAAGAALVLAGIPASASAAHCPAGQFYRPSIGVCESRADHERTMRAVGRTAARAPRVIVAMTEAQVRAAEAAMVAEADAR